MPALVRCAYAIAGLVAGILSTLWFLQTSLLHPQPDTKLQASRSSEPRRPAGLWQRREPTARSDEDVRLGEEIERLRALGYVTGHDPRGEVTGVLAHDSARALDGLNLYTSGHAPAAYLTTMKGEVVHRWEKPFAEVWPDRSPPEGSTGKDYFRRVHLFDDGEMIAIYEGLGLVRLSRDSEVVWARPESYHHDLFVEENGAIWTLDREPRVLPTGARRCAALEDFVTMLDTDGRVLRRWSILEALRRSEYEPLLDSAKSCGDIFHTNTIERLDGSLGISSPAFRIGNLLLSIPHLNLVAIADPEKERIVWAMAGMWRRQHQPTVLGPRRILLFDNGNAASRVIEFDPLTQRIHWSYSGNRAAPFFSKTLGSVQRLENGNTLITESDRGRVFEVTSDGDRVWEFLNPNTDGDLVAVIPEMVRLPSEEVRAWLPEKPSSPE